MRTSYRSYRPSGRHSGPPSWLVFVIAVALVFGLYYVWIGLRGFMETGGLGVREATAQAAIIATATGQREATRVAAAGGLSTRIPDFPTPTPLPACQDFGVIVPNAIVRDAPSTNARMLEQLPFGTVVCVISRQDDWYLIDQNPRTRRLEPAYMRADLIEAVNPTSTPLPTVTLTRTFTPSATPPPSATPSASPTPDPRTASPTPPPTERPSATPTPTPSPVAMQGA